MCYTIIYYNIHLHVMAGTDGPGQTIQGAPIKGPGEGPGTREI